MLLTQVATRLNTTPEQLERDSLRVYLERKRRVTESELFVLARRYGVETVFELDEAVRAGRFHAGANRKSHAPSGTLSRVLLGRADKIPR